MSQETAFVKDYSKYAFHDSEKPELQLEKGLNEEVVRQISELKNEPKWMLDFRLKSLQVFYKKPIPKWGGDMSEIDFDDITYYLRPSSKTQDKWEDVPEYVKNTFEKLGIPEAEKKFLAGVGAQYDSETVYHSIRKDLSEKGVVFLGMDEGLKQYPDLVKKYFGTVIPKEDNKFAALNSAVWSGGSFVYVPKNVSVDIPLQAYFRINAEKMGQFERTLIIADEGSKIHYVEGCTAPQYSSKSLHTAVVEVLALPGAHVRYTTIQNWANNIYNLVTKRAMAHKNATVEWVDGNLGCLTADTKVFLNNNVKNISEVEVGEFVYSLTPEFEISRQKIVGKKINPPRDVYEISTENHRSVKATSNHPFLVARKNGTLDKISWMPLEQIKAGDKIAISGNIPDHGRAMDLPKILQKGLKKVRFPEKTSENLLWLLGFYIGDGYKDRQRTYFAVPETDKSHEKVKKLMKELFELDMGKRGVVLRTSSIDLVKWLHELGLNGKAKEKRIPDWVYKLPASQKLSFIQGYLDADGYMRHNHKNKSISSANKALLEDTKNLAISCGLNPLKISQWTRRDKLKLAKEVKEYTNYFLYFGEMAMESPIYFARVNQIEPKGKEVTYDIEVEGTHNFIANGVFVHNSKLTMKYPSVYLVGENARADILSIAFAGKGQHQDAGAKAVHLAPNTSSTIVSKSISKDGGRTSYRGLVKVQKGCTGVKSSVRCDALLLDEQSRSDTYPSIEIDEPSTTIAHEATVGKVGEDQLFYLMSRGLSREAAMTMVVLGFFQPFTKSLPMEYAVELNRLIELEMEGSIG